MSTQDILTNFVATRKFWRTEVPTDIVLSRDGVADLLARLDENDKENRKPFFVIDKALTVQPQFKPLLGREPKFLFDATASEPRTDDVDMLVRIIRDNTPDIDLIVGVGGGGTIDLAKAAGICAANPKSAAEYQGWGLEMSKGLDIWVLPTLSGTGAEITPIAVLRGPEKKLGINNPHTAPAIAIIDPQLSREVSKFNRVYTMLDCYFHHYEITLSKTSAPDAIEDAWYGLDLARQVLGNDLTRYDLERAVLSVKASILGGSSTIGGRVGAAHAISYGLSNASPTLRHSVAVTLSRLGLKDLYQDDGYEETLRFLRINDLPAPRARDYGITEASIDKMVKTAIGMDKLWLSHFGESWRTAVTPEFLTEVYLAML